MTGPARDPSPASPRRFETSIDIDAPRDAVWRALTDGAEIERWFASEAEVEPRVGGKIVWRWGDLHTWTHRIEVWQPGERLLTRYGLSGAEGHGEDRPLLVDFVLEGKGGRTTLRVVQSGFGPGAEFDREYDGISHGWPVELTSLQLYLERHRGKDRATTWIMHPTNVTAPEAWARLTGATGLGCGPALDGLAPGAPFELRTAAGDVLAGRALRCYPREFSGVVANLDGAWLRLTVWTYTDPVQIWFWLATYGEAPEQTRAREQRLRAFFARLFPAPVGQRGR